MAGNGPASGDFLQCVGRGDLRALLSPLLLLVIIFFQWEQHMARIWDMDTVATMDSELRAQFEEFAHTWSVPPGDRLPSGRGGRADASPVRLALVAVLLDITLELQTVGFGCVPWH
jgi:hypothetical protein